MAASPASMRPKTSASDQPKYTLLYHGGIPGRGEFIRLAFEATKTPYIDAGNGTAAQRKQVYAYCGSDSLGEAGNPPCFSPPMLKITGAGKGGKGKDLIISQTSNILLYLGRELGLVGEEDGVDVWHVNELALTALDLNNETHDTHHPVSTSEYHEDQKEESLRKAKDFRKNRIPKYLGVFERTLQGNVESGGGKYLVGDGLTYADLTIWQMLDGLKYAFPKEMEARSKEFPLLFGTLYPNIKEEDGVKEYLESERRLGYSMGIFRHYPELDRE
jgi:glutathione S-transferase